MRFYSGPGSLAGKLTVGDVGTFSIVKIVSLSPRVERLKLRKGINVSYFNNESRQCFPYFPASVYITILAGFFMNNFFLFSDNVMLL